MYFGGVYKKLQTSVVVELSGRNYWTTQWYTCTFRTRCIFVSLGVLLFVEIKRPFDVISVRSSPTPTPCPCQYRFRWPVYLDIPGHPVSRHWFARCESRSMRARNNFPMILFLSYRVLIHNIDTKIQKRIDLIKIISFKQTSYIRYRGSMLRL